MPDDLTVGDIAHLALTRLEYSEQFLQKEVAELKEAIRWVVTQQGDDLCWMDAYVKLGKLVGIEITMEQLAMLPKEKMLDNCGKFICHLQTGIGYKPEGLAEENERLRQENKYLKNELEIWQKKN